MAKDVLAKVKLNTGEVVRVGDVGKTVVRKMTAETTIDNMEYNFFYSMDVEDAPPTVAALGEISNIQVEPSEDAVDELQAGDSVIYGTGDLF